MYEDNPFEDEKIAKEWITSIEGERGMIRDKELYPKLKIWTESLKGNLIDIGAGQGICADYVQTDVLSYVGVEPSEVLVERAKAIYSNQYRTFLVGNAYKLPVESDSFDVGLSVNTWFHLKNIQQASRELARVLKSGARFLISTANPNSYKYWERMFDDSAVISDKIIDGKANIPVQSLSRNIIFRHTLDEIVKSLESAGLEIEEIQGFGNKEKFSPHGLFVNILGSK
jgi:SAM-dependent methyltransferase